MKISKQARREAKSLFRTCQINGLLDENRVRPAVQQVLAQKPHGYLAIVSHLARLVKLDQERRTAKVESAAQKALLSDGSVLNPLAGTLNTPQTFF